MRRLDRSRRIFVYSFAVVFFAFLVSACSKPMVDKKLITYGLDFEADGQLYSATAVLTCYHMWDFERGDRWVGNLDDSVIRGTLKDGSKYLASPKFFGCSKGVVHSNISSTIYVRLAGSEKSLVESFDEKHGHSPHHSIRIKTSFVDVKDDGRTLASEANQVSLTYRTSRGGDYYQTVGAKVTPFANPEQAKLDFYNADCPKRADIRAQLRCTDSVFNFHPVDATVSNSEAISTYDGQAFNVVIGQSMDAQTWVRNSGIGYNRRNGSYRVLKDSFVTVNFNNQTIDVPSLLGRQFYLDPALGKVIIFFEDDVNIPFDPPSNIAEKDLSK